MYPFNAISTVLLWMNKDKIINTRYKIQDTRYFISGTRPIVTIQFTFM